MSAIAAWELIAAFTCGMAFLAARRLGRPRVVPGAGSHDDPEADLDGPPLPADPAWALEARATLTELAAVDQLARDLDMVKEVQRFLSAPVPKIRGVQLAACTRPVNEVGGDFLDVLEVEGRRIGLLVGDVAGRGLPAALMLAMALSFFRSMVPGASSPRQVLETVNSLILRYRSDSRLFVRAVYAIYDCRDKTLAIANAGMPSPVLNGRQLDLKGLPLGARAAPGFREEKISLTAGDALVLMSDGLDTTASNGEKLGAERLLQLVGDRTALPATALLDHLLRLAEEWAGGQPSDDMTAICLRVGQAR